MFDYEKLIIEVESKPCLWNIGDSDYHIKHFKALAWTSVCETMYSDWNELSATEKDERGKLSVGHFTFITLYNYTVLKIIICILKYNKIK